MRVSGARSLRRSRRGFALLTTLWVLVAACALMLAVSSAARQASAAAGNRTALARARWAAEECASRARLALEHAMTESEEATWGNADSVVAGVTIPSTCALQVTAAGALLDVNMASREIVVNVLLAHRIPRPRADSLADALLDWRDADRVTRLHGAEEDWYMERRRASPRNAPIQNVSEIRLVRGFEDFAAVDTIFDVEPGRLLLDRVPLAVLRALPGLDDEAIDLILRARNAGSRILDITLLAHQLSPPSRERLSRAYASLAPLVVTEPDAWILEARGYARAGPRDLTSVLELRLVRAGERAAIVRRRTWIE